MTVRPDELASAAADLLGERAYPESQVSYAGVTYWLERADDDVKRLVAVAEDESAFRGFAGTAERIDGGVRFVAETTPENALALRSALPWLTPAPVSDCIPRPASAIGSGWRHPATCER